MAQRRMFSLRIVDTDNFLNMPISARLLYYDLSMRADDDGFVDCPQKILKFIGCSEDDLKILIAKKYVFYFESGICVIKDWKIHNYIQKDRYQETLYQKERQFLQVNNDGAYEACTQNVSNMDTQVRIGKVRDNIHLVQKQPEKSLSLSPEKQATRSYAGISLSDYYKRLPRMYNLIFKDYPNVPKVRDLTENRKRLIKSRLQSELRNLPAWRKYFEWAATSEFLTTNCKATNFDWLLQPRIITNVLEGKYHDGIGYPDKDINEINGEKGVSDDDHNGSQTA